MYIENTQYLWKNKKNDMKNIYSALGFSVNNVMSHTDCSLDPWTISALC